MHIRTLLRLRSPLLLSLFLCLFFIPLIYRIHRLRSQLNALPQHHRYNIILHHSPSWLHNIIGKVVHNPADPLGPPTIIPGLRAAPWAGSWKVPVLSRPTYKLKAITQGTLKESLASPALAMIHIFSISSAAARSKRQLIREHSPLLSVPGPYQHLIEIKFILGLQRQKPDEDGYDEQEEKEIEKEISEYGDIVRLKDLHDGENMNNGKTWEWLRYVGREGGREAWWVLKCDDDTLPIIPNLIPFLLSQDPSKPTYLGTAFGHWTGYHYYFQGMMYGFSWGVVKTMAVANVSREEGNFNWDEDARMGGAMFSLPLAPHTHINQSQFQSQQQLDTPTCDLPEPQAQAQAQRPDLQLKYSLPPTSPDPCTSLVWLDLGTRLGEWRGSWIERAWKGKAVGWHGLKSNEDYLAAYTAAAEEYTSHQREFIWNVPRQLESIAATRY